MFVRWKERRSADRDRGHAKHGSVTHYAVLVESVRVDGRPRQRFVAHIAGYNEGDSRRAREMQAVYFWRQAEGRLNTLNLATDLRARVEAKLAERMPRPSPEFLAELKRRAAEFNAKIFGGADRVPQMVRDAE